MIYKNYEIIAAAIFETEPEKLFIKTRKPDVVMARQICMVYRFRFLKMSLAEAGARYSKDHTTVLHAKKTVNNLYETDKKYRAKVDMFFQKIDTKNPEPEHLIFFEPRFFSISSAYIESHLHLLQVLNGYMSGLEPYVSVKHALKECSADLQTISENINRKYKI